MPLLPRDSLSSKSAGEIPEIPLGGTRAQAMQRLQVGLAGILGVVMLVGLASIIENRAQQTEKNSVPEAASTSEPEAKPSQPDPLVEAGVVPDLPASPTPTPTASGTKQAQPRTQSTPTASAEPDGE